MPVRTIYRQDGGVLIRGFGTVTGTDLLQANNSIYADSEKFSRLEYQLCDFSNVEKIIISPEEVQSIAEQDTTAAVTNGQQLIAIVADQDHIYGLSRMWQALTDDEHVISAVFKSRDEAETWLVQQRAQLASYLSIL